VPDSALVKTAGVAVKGKLRMIQADCDRGLSTLLIAMGSQHLLERYENRKAVIP